MFGRYDDDWNDEETIRQYVFTNDKHKDFVEFEGTSEDCRKAGFAQMVTKKWKCGYVYEMTEYGQLIPDEKGEHEFFWTEDMV